MLLFYLFNHFWVASAEIGKCFHRVMGRIENKNNSTEIWRNWRFEISWPLAAWSQVPDKQIASLTTKLKCELKKVLTSLWNLAYLFTSRCTYSAKNYRKDSCTDVIFSLIWKNLFFFVATCNLTWITVTQIR